MRRLTVLIVRHAIAADRNRLRWPDDALRPLTARGVRRFRKAARGLAHFAPRPDEVWSSPLRRARETAALAAAHAHWPAAHSTPALRPGVATSVLGARLAARCGEPKAPRRLALVGHEPSLSRFIAWAVGARQNDAFELRKGGAALLEFDGPVRAGGARLRWLATPRLLRTLGRRASR